MRHINLITVLSATLLSSTSAFASDVSTTPFESANYANTVDSDLSNANVIGVCGGTIDLEPSLGNEAAAKKFVDAENTKPEEKPQPLPGGEDQRGRHPISPFDLDGDGIVGSADLIIMLSQWGTCAPYGNGLTECSADFNDDGFVLYEDLSLLMRAWTE